MLDHAQARQLMVDCQLRTFDVNDVAVLDAFATVPRERFVQPGAEDFAYIDRTLRISADGGEARAMPAPMVLARMIQALKIRPGARVLDVAAGYGYGTALLTELGARVVALECETGLAQAARQRLGQTAEVIDGPLGDGAAAQAPYDAILVQGRIETRPQVLLDQLRSDGRLVCVFGPDRGAKVTVFVRSGDAFGSRPLFDANLPELRDFVAAHAFTF
ncbi:protein-L-isoaspartate O-methyltransferase family protein [Methylobacterium haplocladii]|uniref:Protein-L-isoaspartate O-methyltransferase n=1 Tax=Methylobacterium haplocladii TaxID=1176176 RepID=A0A512IJY5_9HYPH|nr:protein-L-isoaspartate O-methyltransferase [Methylobacterium haplocladii]GEO97958.1 protein-L-isoaspartate O-methyltransferase [Methylobacterium haplocladii]GJD86010.1 Protein-L-isoaspartate O-methyltransferase [Methylobacterium haplocladii]GLS61009.1 protein-L-isoaspartate O-methyltransferase [Methylobacterium haplocladii]